MNVEMPDGTVIEGVPDGTSRAEILSKWQKYGGQVSPSEEKSAFDSLLRGTGLGVRAVAGGAMNLLALPADIPLQAFNVVKSFLNSAAGTKFEHTPLISEQNERGMTALGLPQPETGGERVASAVLSGATSGGGMARGTAKLAETAAPSIEKMVLEALSKGPGVQTVAGGTGGAGSSIAGELGFGPVGQAIAGFGGAMAGPLAAAGAAGATRTMLRGAGGAAADRYNANIKQATDAGIQEPTVGMGGTRRAQAIESTLAKAPGGSGEMAEAGKSVALDMGKRVQEIADNLAPNVDQSKAGRVIEKGLNAFVDRFKSEQKFLYDKLDAYIPKDAQVGVDNTRTALAELNADIPGAPNLSEWFKNAKIKGIERAFKADTENPRGLSNADAALENFFYGAPDAALPYEAVKKLRTLVGNEIENVSLASDVPRSKWKALYGALTKDMESAAQQAGPDAEKAFARANWYTRAGHERIDGILDRIGKGTPEQTYTAAVGPNAVRNGATVPNAVLRSLLPDERSQVGSVFARDLGTANPSKQNAAGTVFSPETYLTDWNNISEPAKRMLFADPAARKGLEDLAKAASTLREGASVLYNNSGTTQSLQHGMAGGGLAAAVITGNVPVATGILSAIASANVGARLMTNPKFVAWVGRTTSLSPGAFPGALAQLAADSRGDPDVQAFIAALQK